MSQYTKSYNEKKTLQRPCHAYDADNFTWKDGLYIETGPWRCNRIINSHFPAEPILSKE